jgi:hypothetical protein
MGEEIMRFQIPSLETLNADRYIHVEKLIDEKRLFYKDHAKLIFDRCLSRRQLGRDKKSQNKQG